MRRDCASCGAGSRQNHITTCPLVLSPEPCCACVSAAPTTTTPHYHHIRVLMMTLMRRWLSHQTHSPTCLPGSRARASGTHTQRGRPGGRQWAQQQRQPAWLSVPQPWPSTRGAPYRPWQTRGRGANRSSCRHLLSSSRRAAAGAGRGSVGEVELRLLPLLPPLFSSCVGGSGRRTLGPAVDCRVCCAQGVACSSSSSSSDRSDRRWWWCVVSFSCTQLTRGEREGFEAVHAAVTAGSDVGWLAGTQA